MPPPSSAVSLLRLISSATVAGTFSLMLVAEASRPLRAIVEPKLRRVVRNLTTGALSLAVMTVLQTPLLVAAARWAERNDFGLLHLGALPRWAVIAIAILLLDYTLWIWHWASHVVPFLWRFHVVHHADLDLDASTALRFHFGELALSILYRMMQIAVIGADTYSVWLWQTILFASILFHHANIRLPLPLERLLVRFIVTPRMHGIHHSARREETNSNWSSILSCWDFLHRTARLDVPQSAVTIGVPAYRDARELTLGRILLMPFVRQRDSWRSSSDQPVARISMPAGTFPD